MGASTRPCGCGEEPVQEGVVADDALRQRHRLKARQHRDDLPDAAAVAAGPALHRLHGHIDAGKLREGRNHGAPGALDLHQEAERLEANGFPKVIERISIVCEPMEGMHNHRGYLPLEEYSREH